MREITILGEQDPIKIEALERGTLLNYWFLLNTKMEEISKAKREKDRLRGHNTKSPGRR